MKTACLPKAKFMLQELAKNGTKITKEVLTNTIRKILDDANECLNGACDILKNQENPSLDIISKHLATALSHNQKACIVYGELLCDMAQKKLIGQNGGLQNQRDDAMKIYDAICQRAGIAPKQMEVEDAMTEIKNTLKSYANSLVASRKYYNDCESQIKREIQNGCKLSDNDMSALKLDNFQDKFRDMYADHKYEFPTYEKCSEFHKTRRQKFIETKCSLITSLQQHRQEIDEETYKTLLDRILSNEDYKSPTMIQYEMELSAKIDVTPWTNPQNKLDAEAITKNIYDVGTKIYNYLSEKQNLDISPDEQASLCKDLVTILVGKNQDFKNAIENKEIQDECDTAVNDILAKRQKLVTDFENNEKNNINVSTEEQQAFEKEGNILRFVISFANGIKDHFFDVKER